MMRRIKTLNYFCILLLITGSAYCEQDKAEVTESNAPPGTEIVLADVKIHKNQVTVSNPQNVTSRKGYDSQGVFMEKDRALYFSRHIDKQNDIYRMDIKTRIAKPYMQTPESEYSPTPIAGRDGISVVRVELEKNKDGSDAQHVTWLYKKKRKNRSGLMSDMSNIGYHNWTGKNKLWMYIINGEQGDLYYQTIGKKPKKLASNIGRTLKTDSRYKFLYYVDKSKDDWWINKISAKTFKKSKLIKLPKDVEDFAIDTKGNFWCGKGNILYHSNNGKNWMIVHEFFIPGLENITRIDLNTRINKIAITFDEISDEKNQQ